jgi:hypothetical protein
LRRSARKIIGVKSAIIQLVNTVLWAIPKIWTTDSAAI